MSQVQDVKAANDIVTIVGERVQLKQAGSYLKGLCPFHSEKSPSFFVSPALQRYKCYGCSGGGDVLSFLQKYDSLTFYEALQTLAERAGITLTSDHKSGDDQLRSDMLNALGLARDYYHFLLTEHKTGETARQYLKNRGTTNESLKVFQLGYALPQWDGLSKFLHGKKKIPLVTLEKAGLVVRGKYGRYYDRFRDRIMFPLKDTRGYVVGFSGRLLSPDAKEAKYVNSPETPLYHKSKLLFGYSELKREIQKKRQVVVVEGEFDVITSTQAAVNNVVAIKGSALTHDHGQLLSRLADTIILSLDTDSAGVEATRKSIQVLKPFDVELRVVQLPSGKDPDDLAKKDPKAWRQAVKQHVSAYEFLINAAVANGDAISPRGQRTIIKGLAPILAGIESQVEQEFYLQKLAEKLNLDTQLVRADIEAFARHPEAVIAPAKPKLDAQTGVAQLTRVEQLERYLLFLLLKQDGQALETACGWLLSQRLLLPPLLKQVLQASKTIEGAYTWQNLQRALPSDIAQHIMDIAVEPEFVQAFAVSTFKKEWQQTTDSLLQEMKRQRREEISRQLDRMKDEPRPEDPEVQQKLLAELTQL